MANLTERLDKIENALIPQLVEQNAKLGALISMFGQHLSMQSQMLDRLDIAQSMGGSTNTLLTQIRNAIGPLDGTPQNRSARWLLAAIAECICEPVTAGEPEGPENPLWEPDPEACTSVSGGPFRATRYELMYDAGDGPELDHYLVQFDGLGEVSPIAEVNHPHDSKYKIYHPLIDTTFCYQWDFTDNIKPAGMRFAVSNTPLIYGGTPFNLGINRGGGSFQIDSVNSQGEPLYGYLWLVTEPNAPLPNLNVWISWDNGAS